jgi:NADPH2:quinone reductase
VRALVCRAFGPVSNLAVEEVPAPSPGDGEVAIRVAAAGLNFPDALVVQGKYQVKPPLPFTPGMELAGEVAEVGPGAGALRPGDPVMATTTFGAFAEVVKLPASRVLPRPPALAPEAAAGMLITYGTTWHALHDRAALAPGETVLVLGAAGGVGTAAVEIAKLAGARVIAAASSEAKLEVCRRLGADATVNYATEDLRERVKALTGGKGVDVVYDPVGGPYSEAALRSTGWNGRHLVVGFAAGEIPKLPLNLALLNARSIVGVYWGDWSQRNPAASAAEFARIGEEMVAGRLRPEIGGRVRLEEIPRALEDLLGRRVTGKIVAVP